MFELPKRINGRDRTGAIVPMFALFLPILFLLSGFAINLAYMQLVATEMKIATDVTSHAAGRAMSEAQRDQIITNEDGDPLSAQERREYVVNETLDAVRTASAWNLVGGKELSINEADDTDILFGVSRRLNGNGMYDFSSIPVEEVRNGADRASSVAVTGSIDIPLAFQVMRGITSFNPARRSVATQVDRDIALVLDRSGSMLHYKDEDELEDIMETLYNTWERKVRRRYNYYYRYWYNDYYSERKISWNDYRAAVVSNNEIIYDRSISRDVVDEMWDWYSDNGGSSNLEVYQYVSDWRRFSTRNRTIKTHAPRHSRWDLLTQGVDAFLDVLGGKLDGSEVGTDQKELVSLVTFNSNASVDVALTDDDETNGGTQFYQNIRDEVDAISPTGGTGIGRGLQTGLPPIVDPDWASDNGTTGSSARPFAAKTIVVLTDGQNTSGDSPQSVVGPIVADNAVTIHTVTFTPGASQAPMRETAAAGGGNHYHADEGNALIQIFEEIANNLPTILTE
jgi:hypothetical protein